MVRALLVRKDEEGKTSAAVEDVAEDQFPDGNVTVAVEFSTVNYKDGLCIGPGGGLSRDDIADVDFAVFVVDHKVDSMAGLVPANF